MLTNTNNNALQQYKKVNSEFIFFYQRWQEMLESRTLDMYQYNILNSCVACVELSEVIKNTLLGLLTSPHNIKDVMAEALEIIKADDVLLKYLKPVRNVLLRILSTKIQIKTEADFSDENSSTYVTSLRRLKYQLETPLRVLQDSFLGYVLQELRNDIDNQDYCQIEKHMVMLISQCVYNGWSTKGLFLLSKCFEGDNGFEEKWMLFSQKVATLEKNQYEIFFSIKIETRTGVCAENVREIIRSLGMVFKKGEDIIIENQLRENLKSKISFDSYYIMFEMSSHDLYSAVLSAINQLNRKLSIATFFNIINPWIASTPQIVVCDLSSGLAEALTISDVFRTYDYIDSNNNVFDYTNAIFSNPEKVHIASKLSAAFAYTNLSRASLFQETKYISLWIAIESVMRTGQYQDIISHVKCVLPEILCMRYIYHIVRNFSEDCIRCGFKTDTTLQIDMRSDNKKQLVQDLISILRDPNRYAVLLIDCNKNDLLTFRCKEIHDILLDVNSILKKFEHYTTKVRWHIQRLYRIRNEITHSAFQEDKSLVIYIEHLYTYLAQLMSEVVYYVERKNVGSAEEAFATILESYKTYREFLVAGGVPIQDVLPDGIIDILS